MRHPPLRAKAMSEQVMISRELLDLAAKAIEQKMCIQCEGVPCCWTDGLEALAGIRAAQPVSAHPDHSVQHLNMVSAHPAGEVPEVVGYLLTKGNQLSRMPAGNQDRPLMTVAQHTRIIAALQARAVVMPERMKTQPFTTIDRGSKNYKAGWNGCLNELARLNGKGGV
jgi:hypothetical protein